jgi:hypothetical protein
MEFRPVIIVGREESIDACVEALAARDLRGIGVDLGQVEAEIRQRPPSALVLASMPGDAAMRMVGHLRRRHGASLPVIVSIGRKDLKLRDRCLDVGATDVCVEGDPDSIAGLVDVAVNGWLRTAPVRAWNDTLTVQRRGEPVALAVTDIDPTGIALRDGADLEPDELHRLTLPFSDGELLLWARVSHASGEPGLRFVAMTTEDRLRLSRLLRKGEVPHFPKAPEPAELVVESRLVWPPGQYDLDATEIAVGSWVEGLELKWSPGVPSPEFVHEFLAGQPSAEHRLFDPIPPVTFANPILYRRAQLIRMHLQSLARDGFELQQGASPVELNTSGLTAIFLQVDQILAKLYQYAAEQHAEQQRAHAEQAQGYLRALLADVDTLRPITRQYGLELPDLSAYTKVATAPTSLPPALPELAEATAQHDRIQRQPLRFRQPPSPRRKRILLVAAALVLISLGLTVWAFASRSWNTLRLGPEFAGHVDGVRELVVTPAEVQVIVEQNWNPSQDDLDELRRHLNPMGKRVIRIVDPQNRTLTSGGPGKLAMP